MSIFKKDTVNTNASKEIETLYSSRKTETVIQGIEIPKKWSNLNTEELRNEAKNAILALSKSSNSDFKAKELGFKDAKHLLDLCFDYILK